MILRIAAVAAAAATAFQSPSLADAARPAPTPSPMPLTLVQAESIALASSPQLALARAQLAQAQASIGVARSGELPGLTASGSSTGSKSTTPANAFGPGSPPQSFSTFTRSKSGSIDLHQLLIDGGRVHEAVQAARRSSDAAQLSLTRQMQSVEFSVAQAYYAALQARHQLTTADDSLNLAKVQERLVNAQFKAGVASKADVLTAQLPVAQAELAVAQAANGEQTQVALLLNTMGLPAQTSVSIADEGAAPVMLPALNDVLNAAAQQRPDLLAAQASLDAANASVRSAHLGLFPSVSGSATTGTSSTNASPYAPSNSLGISVSVPIFDGGITRAQTQVAQAQADQAGANLKTTQLLVSLNVQQAYLGVQTAEAGLTAASAEYAQARTVLDVTNAQYKSGVTTLPLLLNAQVGLAKAESDQVNAVYAYKTAWQQLLLAEGTIGR